jgi:hypothetical protein
MTIFGREPAFWIGLAVSLVLGVVSTLTGNGLISDALAGQITDIANSIAQLLVLLAPLIAGILIRQRVTPTGAPALPTGTIVTVLTPGDMPNHTTTL